MRWSSEAWQNVNDGQHQNPDEVDEMPVESDRLESRRAAIFRVAGTRQPEQDEQCDQARRKRAVRGNR